MLSYFDLNNHIHREESSIKTFGVLSKGVTLDEKTLISATQQILMYLLFICRRAVEQSHKSIPKRGKRGFKFKCGRVNYFRRDRFGSRSKGLRTSARISQGVAVASDFLVFPNRRFLECNY